MNCNNTDRWLPGYPNSVGGSKCCAGIEIGGGDTRCGEIRPEPDSPCLRQLLVTGSAVIAVISGR